MLYHIVLIIFIIHLKQLRLLIINLQNIDMDESKPIINLYFMIHF